MKQAIMNLKNDIKAATTASREIRKQIHESSGKSRWCWWEAKRARGADSRVLLLAYACLRGRSYESVERKCAPGNEPSCRKIHEAITDRLGKDAPDLAEWTRERVRAWLTRPEPRCEQQPEKAA